MRVRSAGRAAGVAAARGPRDGWTRRMRVTRARAAAALVALALCGCVHVAAPARPGDREPAPPPGVLSSLPAPIDPAARYLLYFHPKIVEDQGLPAVSPEHGPYRYEEILGRFARAGFTVVSELRPKDADAREHATRGVAQVEALLAAGVAPGNILVVGASKGAYIASLVSHLARQPRLNVVLLAGCSADTVAYMRGHGIDLHGNVLAIRDVADTRWAGSCAQVFAASPGLGRHDEIVLGVGSGHGIVFEPLEAWVRPALAWPRDAR